MSAAQLGPVSSALEADLRTWVRRQAIVLWLDLDDHYTGFVDRLIALRERGEIPYEVRAFRGSHLELLFALEPLESGVEKTPLVVHLPGFNEESVRETPLLELYFAGARYRKSPETLLSEAAGGKVAPELIAAFQGRDGFTLEEADAWLASLLSERSGGLEAHLGLIAPHAFFDDLLEGGVVSRRVASPADREVIWERLRAWTGLPADWVAEVLPGESPRAEDIAFVGASWALSVEYVHDLKRPPVSELLQAARNLPGPVIEGCQALAAHLRERHREFYRRTADETEAILGDEIEAARAQDLGKIDTFRFEEDKVLLGALEAVDLGQWDAASAWASARELGEAFWLREDPARRSAWLLLADAARLGAAIQTAGPSLDARGDMERAIERYASLGAAVDRAHRHLEQRRVALLYPPLPEFDALRAALDRLRSLWRDWADRWAVDFNALCKARGFLADESRQQRTLFDEVVRPLARESGTTALLLVDGFRFEMAQELYATLADTPATTAQLRPRLAELPTVTEVGMNVLAPVADRGRLRPAIAEGAVLGFSTGEFRVSDPESRKRAMHDRVGGGTCPMLSLDDVVSRDATSLKQAVARASLVVVHSDEVDRAGERGLGPAVFDQVLQKIRAGWRLLRDAGVRRFVVTADHGFLLVDEGARPALPHGRKIDPKRRHVFSGVPADHPGEVRVALSELGYESGEQLMFPETTAVFDTGRRPTGYVHGGNSLQERVIPVLTLVHRAAAGASSTRYAIRAAAREGVAGMHCIEASVRLDSQQELDFGGVREVELGLRVPDLTDARVEVCQTRGAARLVAGTVVATVGQGFELFFRLSGPVDARVLVELFHRGGESEVTPCTVDGRFQVSVVRGTQEVAAPRPAPEAALSWLESLPEGGVRTLFGHLATHGAVTEPEVASMLGGPRGLRRFANEFEEHAAKAPFGVRIDVVGGVKRYVREGTA